MAPTTSGLDRAISNDDLVRLQHLVRQQPWLKHSSPFGYSTVFLAARRGSVRILSWLLNHGGDANGRSVSHHKSSLSIPALHASLTNGHFEAAKLLVQHGADLKTRSRNMDALDHAIARLDADAVTMLLDHGASLDAEYGFYNAFTKVHAAAKFRDADVLEAILSRGGDPFVRIPTRGWTYVRSIMGWGPRDFLMRPGGGKRGREEARLALQVLVKWENFHMRERVRPILRARAVVQMSPDGVIATQRTLTGRPLPTITFLLPPQPHNRTHTPPHVHSHTQTPTAGVCVAHTGVCCASGCCDGCGAPGAVGGGGGGGDDLCVVEKGGTASNRTPEAVAPPACGVVSKGESDSLMGSHTDPCTPNSDDVACRREGEGCGVPSGVAVEVMQGRSKLIVDGSVVARHGVRDSARRAVVKRVRRKTWKEQIEDESKGDRAVVMMGEDSCSHRGTCRKRRTEHCHDAASSDAVRTRLSAHAVKRDLESTTRAKVGRVADYDKERAGEGGPDPQLAGVVRNLCVVSPELLRHVVSFIITPVPK